MDAEEVKTLHKEWFKQFSKENPDIPFMVLKDFNAIIDRFLIKYDSVIQYIFDDSGNKLGWLCMKAIQREIKEDEKLKIGHVNYMFLNRKLKEDEYEKLKVTEGKIFTVFKCKPLKKVYKKKLIYFPWYWMFYKDVQKFLKAADKEQI